MLKPVRAFLMEISEEWRTGGNYVHVGSDRKDQMILQKNRESMHKAIFE